MKGIREMSITLKSRYSVAERSPSDFQTIYQITNPVFIIDEFEVLNQTSLRFKIFLQKPLDTRIKYIRVKLQIKDYAHLNSLIQVVFTDPNEYFACDPSDYEELLNYIPEQLSQAIDEYLGVWMVGNAMEREFAENYRKRTLPIIITPALMPLLPHLRKHDEAIRQ